jgi:3-deoxy-D-manno-octulosonate 8-phosphate phosphatase (KDO 8-P phosphatase)
MSKLRAKKIKLFIFDVDGVLTDGKLFFIPQPLPAGADPNTQTSVEVKGFHAHDGAGISLIRLAGIKTGLITKRTSATVGIRARDLKIDHIHQGIQDKLGVFREILKKEGLTPAEAAYVGDDVIDLPVLRNCGLAIGVANARKEVKEEVHYVTPHAGGDGALRDAIEYILKAQGKWEKTVEAYIGERGSNKD